MAELTAEDMQRWLAGWRAASARMAELRKRDLKNVDIAQVIEDLDDAFESALLHFPAPTTSGLVIQQAWFAKGRR